MRKVLTAAFMLVLGCAGISADQGGEKPTTRFELRLAESKAAEGLTEAIVVGSKNKVYLHKATLLSAQDIAQAKVVSDANDRHMIELTFTDTAGKKFGKATEQHLGKPLAIIVDGKVIFAPVVRTPITDGKAQVTGAFSKEEAERIAKAIRGK